MRLGRLGQRDEAQGRQSQGQVDCFSAKLIQGLSADLSTTAFKSIKPRSLYRVAVCGGYSKGVAAARCSSRVGRVAGWRRQHFLIERTPGRQPGTVGEAFQGEALFVRREPCGGGSPLWVWLRAGPGPPGPLGRGSWPGVCQGSQVEDRVPGYGCGPRVRYEAPAAPSHRSFPLSPTRATAAV